jgi:hypothetical protein
LLDDAHSSSRAFMTRRVLAWSLLVLAASQFTAPFSTCDLATRFGDSTRLPLNKADTCIVWSAPDRLSPIDNDAVLAVSLFAPIGGRAKALAIARFRLQPTSSRERSGGASTWPDNPMRLPDGRPVAPTILRL